MDDRDDSTRELAGVRLPAEPERAKEQLGKLTAGWTKSVFWVPEKPRWLHKDNRPEGTREYPHIAMVILDEERLRKGHVLLRYHDGVHVPLMVEELAMGHTMLPGEVSERWCVCDSGEKDLQGRLHE